MSTEYNISNLFLQGFGLKVRDGYSIGIKDKPTNPKGAFSGIEIVEDLDEAFELSAMGTPILFPINFIQGTYKRYNDKGEIVDQKMNNFRLPIACVISSLDRGKTMTETKVNGGRGSVKEIYGFEDWQIVINGFFIPDDSQPEGFKTPRAQEKELVKWDNLACSIAVSCALLQDKNINFLTIRSIKIDAMPGKPNVRLFTINASSDEPIELNIKSAV